MQGCRKVSRSGTVTHGGGGLCIIMFVHNAAKGIIPMSKKLPAVNSHAQI